MRTIPQMFEDSCRQYPENPLIYEKSDGKYQSITYQNLKNNVFYLAAELISLGVQKSDRVALLAEGSSKWLVAELAVLYIGAVSVPLSVKINEPDELLFRIKHAGCSFIFISATELPKIRSIRKRIPSISKFILFEERGRTDPDELSYEALLEKGKQSLSGLIHEIESRWKGVGEDDLANISYTSGTTADPKGIMLTHRNYTANVEQACSLFEVPEWYTTLLILSWDHSFAHTVGLYVLISNGASIAVVEQGKTPMERLRNIPKNIREVKPVFQLSVPAIARSFKKSIESGVKSKGKFTQRLFNLALKTAYAYHGNGWENKSVSRWLLVPLILVFEKLLFQKIRGNFGGRLRFFIGGGALLDMELQQFFYAIGIPMFQGYGLTEAAPVISSNTPESHKLGSSGRAVKNLELRILDDAGNICPTGTRGEIVVKGENVMKGYWQNEKATHETLKDGWLYTGDLGYLDNDGFLHVLGRFKSLLIGNDGEKYSPEGIEEALVDHSQYIEQVMLYNNQNPFTTGLVVPSVPALLERLRSDGFDPQSREGAIKALRLIESDVRAFYPGGKLGNMFPSRWLPTAIAILDEGFTEENGLINSTLKLVRSKVAGHFSERLTFLYTPAGKNLMNEKNITAIQTRLKT